VVSGEVVRRNADAEGFSPLLSEKRQRIARTARSRNRLLLWLGYTARVPYSELEGEAAPKARKTYLCGVPCAFTKSDRSMAVWDAKRGAWRLAVDEHWYPQLFATKAAALAKGRTQEKSLDALAAKLAPPPAVLVRARGWARQRDAANALEHMIERRQDGAY